MATEARIGWGGHLYLSTDNTEANLAEIAEVRTTGFPQEETDEHEVTHLQSPGRHKEYIQGLIDSGEFTAQINYAPGSASDLLLTDAKQTGTTRRARIVIPDNDGLGTAAWNVTFSCFIKKYAPDAMEPNAPITATITIRVTGAPEEGTGASGS